MTADEILVAALEKRTPVERAAYLDGACGVDGELRALVEKLLRSHEEAGSFLEQPLFEPAQTIDLPRQAETPGTVIGPYKLLQQIGEGGMGTVYMAEQTEPVKRKVALKVIKAGMDSRQVIARFEAERQALAMMDHVNIARVFDGGTTENGRPYFVMELVHGVPITKYCDDNHLTPRQRLELFVPVCQAIQHAHQKGIIHRDVKPSNVMVTLYDGKPVPKVIDFGVAKATEQKLTERTLFTQYGTMVGTLEYMSPEQAEMSDLGVDTRSDIYSLGVLLYELLTGTTPLTHKRMKEAAYAEILRMIKEEEPPRPSTRLSESGEALASISAQRQTEPAKLTRLVRGELDWIVMKTLEKDRNRRYETANAFAADVQRYLNDEAVQACPPTAGYRFRKFSRRNRVVLTTAALVSAALVLGTGVSIWQAIRAADARELAQGRLVAETDARNQAEAAQKLATEQRLRADANFQRALDAVDRMLTRVAQKLLASEPRTEQLRRTLFEDALKFYQAFLVEKGDDPDVRLETGAAYRRVGQIQRHLGQHDQAKETHRQGIAVLQQLASEFPENPRAQKELALSHYGLARTLVATRRHQDAEREYDQALKLLRKLVTQFPSVPEYQKDFSIACNDLGAMYGAMDRAADAEKAYRESLEVLQVLAGIKPDDDEVQSAIGGRLNNLAILFAERNELPKACEYLRQAITHQRAALKVDPRQTQFRLYLRNHLENLTLMQRGFTKPADSLEAFREIVALSAELVKEFPNVPQYGADLAGSYHHLANVLRDTHAQEARQAYDLAHAVYAQLVADYPTVPQYQYEWAASSGDLARWQKSLGQMVDAGKTFQRAAETFETLVGKFPESQYQDELARAYLELGQIKQADQKNAEGMTAFSRALVLAKAAVAKTPRKGVFWETLGSAHFHNRNWQDVTTSLVQAMKLGSGGGASLFLLAMAHHRLGNADEARKAYDRGVEWMEKKKPDDAELRRFRAEAAEQLGINETRPPKKD